MDFSDFQPEDETTVKLLQGCVKNNVSDLLKLLKFTKLDPNTIAKFVQEHIEEKFEILSIQTKL